MNESEIFELALGIKGTPWKVTEVKLDTEGGTLDICLDFPPGTRFPHPSTGEACAVYDTEEKTWRHLNFFQYQCYLHAWIPRVDGGEAGGVKTVSVPWARPGSGFTLMMEALLLVMGQTGMTVSEVARMAAVTAHRVWRVLHRYVGEAHAKMDLGMVEELGIDETSVRRGHQYVTVVTEPRRKGNEQQRARPTRVLFVAEGKDADTLRQAREFLESRQVRPQQIERICSDMSAAYKKGIQENFPDAEVVFDQFHTVQLITKAVDDVRRRESKKVPELLKGTRYLWLTREENLSEAKREQRRQLCRSKLQTAKAFCHLEAFQDLYRSLNGDEAVEGLKWWYNWVCHSRIPEMIKAAKTIKENWHGVVAYLHSRLTNGPAEALNGIIQTVKRKSRGFRNFVYFRTMIYLVGSKLKFDLPWPLPASPHETS
jgi:transposase